MIYSCFDPRSGMYHYFENRLQVQVNADLPVPKLPPSAGKVGVPSIDAGRPLPRDARPIGEGRQAKGIIVACGFGSRNGNGALGASEGTISEGWEWTKAGGWKWIVGGAVAIWVLRRI